MHRKTHIPTLSVIVTFHNESAYLEQCLTSILGQSLSDIEVICVDDSSTDSTPKLLKKFERADSRVAVLNSSMKSLPASRNIGLREATGEYVAFVDGDDFLDPGYYEALHDAARDAWPGGADGARSGYTSLWPDRQQDDRFCEIIERRATEGCLLNSWDNSNVVWNAIYRRSSLLGAGCYYFREDPKTTEDLFWTLRAMHRLRIMVPVAGVRYWYRMDKPNRLSSITVPNALNLLKANKQALDYIQSAIWGNVDEYYHQFERILWRYALWEERLRGLVGDDHPALARTHRDMRDAYAACRHPQIAEHIHRNDWWPKYDAILGSGGGAAAQRPAAGLKSVP